MVAGGQVKVKGGCWGLHCAGQEKFHVTLIHSFSNHRALGVQE